jgi:hypothetical protein
MLAEVRGAGDDSDSESNNNNNDGNGNSKYAAAAAQNESDRLQNDLMYRVFRRTEECQSVFAGLMKELRRIHTNKPAINAALDVADVILGTGPATLRSGKWNPINDAARAPAQIMVFICLVANDTSLTNFVCANSTAYCKEFLALQRMGIGDVSHSLIAYAWRQAFNPMTIANIVATAAHWSAVMYCSFGLPFALDIAEDPSETLMKSAIYRVSSSSSSSPSSSSSSSALTTSNQGNAAPMAIVVDDDDADDDASVGSNNNSNNNSSNNSSSESIPPDYHRQHNQ